MTTVTPSSVREHLRRFNDILDKKDVKKVDGLPFVADFGVCEIHGKYAKNTQDETGHVRSFRPGCQKCRKIEETKKLLTDCNIPKRFSGCTFDNYKPTNHEQGIVLNQCRVYAENFHNHRDSGSCLILCGNPGTGKNHLATAISKQLLESDYSVLRVKASEYLDAYWGKGFEDREGWVKRMAKVDLLMIDEIGRSSNAKAAQDAFFRLIDARYEAQLPTLIATNLNRDGLIDVLGTAAYDRLRQGGNLLTFSWKSYREPV